MRSLLGVALVAGLTACAAHAPPRGEAAPLGEAIPCAEQHPAHDVVDSYFELVSGPAGERVEPGFVELFAAGSRIDAMGIDADGRNALFPQSPQEFVHHIDQYRERVGFFHTPVSISSSCYVRAASADIWFESRNSPDGDLVDDGLLSMHLLRLDDGWRITHVQWNSRPR